MSRTSSSLTTRTPTVDSSAIDRSFNELFDPANDDPGVTMEILSPIIESPAPPYQKLMRLPLSVPRPLVSHSSSRYRSSPPEFRPSLPVLPKHLHHLIDAAIIPSAFHSSHKGRGGMPSWLMTGLVAFLMGVAGIAIVNFMAPAKSANAASQSQPAPTLAPPTQQSQSTPASAGGAEGNSKRLVELTGFRIRQDRAGKTIVQYVVINHSDGEAHGLTAHIVLRASTAKPFQAPVANFSVRLPSMAALESKDLTTMVDSPTDRAMPDWTELKAEVRIEQ